MIDMKCIDCVTNAASEGKQGVNFLNAIALGQVIYGGNSLCYEHYLRRVGLKLEGPI